MRKHPSSSILLFLLSLLVATPGAMAGDDQGEPALYDLAFLLEQNGEKLGEPRLLVKPGKPARIEVTSEDVAEYRLDVVAMPVTTADGASNIDVATSLYRMNDGEWSLVSEPRMVVAPGKEASMSMGGESDPGQTLAVTLVAQPIDRASAERMRTAWEESQGKSLKNQ